MLFLVFTGLSFAAFTFMNIIITTLKGIGGQVKDSWTEGDGTTSVVTIRIADFINNVVATRRQVALSASFYRTQVPWNCSASVAFFNLHLCHQQKSIRIPLSLKNLFKLCLSRLPETEGHELPPAVIMKLDVEGKVKNSL